MRIIRRPLLSRVVVHGELLFQRPVFRFHLIDVDVLLPLGVSKRFLDHQKLVQLVRHVEIGPVQVRNERRLDLLFHHAVEIDISEPWVLLERAHPPLPTLARDPLLGITIEELIKT